MCLIRGGLIPFFRFLCNFTHFITTPPPPPFLCILEYRTDPLYNFQIFSVKYCHKQYNKTMCFTQCGFVVHCHSICIHFIGYTPHLMLIRHTRVRNIYARIYDEFVSSFINDTKEAIYKLTITWSNFTSIASSGRRTSGEVSVATILLMMYDFDGK